MRKNYIANLLIAIFLVAVTLAAYSRVADCEFLQFDDQACVQNNPQVKAGLTIDGVRWAFAGYNQSNWIPLTWLSLMLDSWQFGEDAAAFHQTNLILHVLNTLLLFGLLAYVTGCKWRGGIVAALFAVHPMHVESVAWIAERKDVLSTFFAFAALWGYAWYCRRPGIGRYLAFTVLFALGLMAKSMLVTLPILMLLMDFWPLKRTAERPLGRLVVEKVPLLVLSAAICVVTVLAQSAGGATKPLHVFPVGVRIANAAVAAVIYLWKMVWPVNLAFFYPHPGKTLPVLGVLGCVALLLILSAVALKARGSRPYFLVGWLWYVITLLPVLGIIQVGWQAMADRYTYLPYIGLFFVVVWGLYDLAGHLRFGRIAACLIAVGVIVTLTAVTRQQVSHWQDDYALCNHALAVTTDNAEAHYVLASRLVSDGRLDEAMEHLDQAAQIDPRHELVWGKIGLVYLNERRFDEAAAALKMATSISPRDTAARLNYGIVLREEGQLDEAIAQYKAILRYSPDQADAKAELEQTEAMK